MKNANQPHLIHFAFALLGLSSAPTFAQPQPPILPGEIITATKNGCSLIFDGEAVKRLPEPYNDVEKRKSNYGQYIWSGACAEGLLEGRGQLRSNSNAGGISSEEVYFRGRRLEGKQYTVFSDGRVPLVAFYSRDRGAMRSAEIPDAANPYSPSWQAPKSDDSLLSVYGTRIKGLDGTSVSTITANCLVDRSRFPECGSASRSYTVYGVVTNAAVWSPNSTQWAWCPNPRSPVGCEVLWESKTGSMIELIKTLAIEVDKSIELQKEKYTDLSLPYEERASTKRVAREAEAKRREVIAAGQLREKQEHDAREAETAAVAEQKARAAVERNFQANLAKSNAGELFVLSNKLEREGKSDSALAARNALISRFPNHSLAATAAQQIAASRATETRPPASSSSAKSSISSSATPPKYASVCDRNLEKLNNLMYSRKIGVAQATYDLFWRDYNRDGARILEPCIAISSRAAETYKRAMEVVNKVNQHCAGRHDPRLECTPWGTSGGVSDNHGNPFNNPAWYKAWKADVDRALADPDFSADLGSAAGGGSAVASARDAATENCATKLKSIDDAFNSARPNIPQNSVVVRSEATMWMITESIKVIESTCPNSEQYKGQPASFRQTLAQTNSVCNRVATRPCIAQLPGSEPSSPPQSASALKPLENKPPASCESSSSTGMSFTSCARDACEKSKGRFAIGSAGCAGCTLDGGSWTLCPKGSGGVSSAQ